MTLQLQFGLHINTLDKLHSFSTYFINTYFIKYLWVYFFLLIITLKFKNNEVKNQDLLGWVACNYAMQILRVPLEYHFQFASFLETLTHVSPVLTQI